MVGNLGLDGSGRVQCSGFAFSTSYRSTLVLLKSRAYRPSYPNRFVLAFCLRSWLYHRNVLGHERHFEDLPVIDLRDILVGLHVTM